MGGKNTKQKKKEEKEAKDDKKDETPNAADAKTPNAESDKQPDTTNEEAKPDDKTGDSGGKEGEAEKPEAADGDAVKSSEPEAKAEDGEKYKVDDIAAGLEKTDENKENVTPDKTVEEPKSETKGDSEETKTETNDANSSVENSSDTTKVEEKVEPSIETPKEESIADNEANSIDNATNKPDSSVDNVNLASGNSDNVTNETPANEAAVKENSENPVSEEQNEDSQIQSNDNITAAQTSEDFSNEKSDEKNIESVENQSAEADTVSPATNIEEESKDDAEPVEATTEQSDIIKEKVPEQTDLDAVEDDIKVPAKVSTEFKWEDGGETVEVSGSFNSWDKMKLEKKDEVFTVAVDLEPGEYLYKYVVDGEWKINKNQATKAGEDGIENNVIEVKAA